MKKLLPILLLLCTSLLWAKGNKEENSEIIKKETMSYPQRVVSLSPSTTEMLFAIGAGEQVVGDTSYCNYPAEAADREIIGGFSAKTISVETIISLNPDLVIAGVSAHQPIVDTLRSAGITVLTIEPKSISDILNIIVELGIITGHEKEANNVSTNISTRIDALNDKLNRLKENERIKVFYEVWDAPLMTAGPKSFTGQMITKAGAINIFSDAKGDYPQISAEELISRNPQVILTSDTHGDKLTVDAMAQREGWESIDAVINNKVILLDGNIVSRPGPRVIDAIEKIANSIYPELF